MAATINAHLPLATSMTPAASLGQLSRLISLQTRRIGFNNRYCKRLSSNNSHNNASSKLIPTVTIYQQVPIPNKLIRRMSCCPKSGWPELKSDQEYKDRGQVDAKVNGSDLDIYRVGSGEKCVLWCYDIFGFNSGRSRQLADLLSEQGYLVIMPDYYRGTMQDPFNSPQEKVVEFLKAQSKWQNLKKDFDEVVRPYAESHGAKIFGAIGTCWGTYPVLKHCADYPGLFKAGVNIHPSHSPIMKMMLNEDEKELVEAVKKAGAAQLMMPAGDDMDTVKKGGLDEQVLGEELCKVIEFNDMRHGFSTRGDIKDEKVRDDVNRAFAETCQWFKAKL